MDKKRALKALLVMFYLMAIPTVYVHWLSEETYSRPPEGINRPSYALLKILVVAKDIAETKFVPYPPEAAYEIIERPRPAGEQSAAYTAARHIRPPTGDNHEC